MRPLAALGALGAAALLLTAAPVARANPCGPVPDTVILFDRSGSMTQYSGSQTKWAIATTAVNYVTSTYDAQFRWGLMLFSRWPHLKNCSSGQINVGVKTYNASAIATVLGSAYPLGDTPIALSLDAARAYLKTVKKSGTPQYVLLITDGKETCQPASVNSPPTAAGKLLSDGVKTYVVGFGSGVDPTSLKNTAVAGGTGNYYAASDLSGLKTVLGKIAAAISCCGDGKLDTGEKCDTAIPPPGAGSCPATCGDGNPCTSDFKVGKACQQECVFQAITKPINGDGCCPPGATSATDSDCPPSCGNGVLDAGEKCDTKIPAGSWGACPSSCDDKNPCTQDTLVGSGCNAHCTHKNTCPTQKCGNGKVDAGEWCDTAIPAGTSGACPVHCNDGKPCTKDIKMGTACLTKCANIPITKPADNDGCCPPGATSKNDNDCPTTCGNGVLDPGETCDPGIKSGPGVCTSSCDDKDPCTRDIRTGGACNPKCSHAAIGSNPNTKDGCCPPGMSQTQDADCLPPCGPDKQHDCVNPCQNVKCPDGHYCKDGKCVPWPKGPDNPQNPPGPDGTGYTDAGCSCQLGPAPHAGLPVLAALAVLLGVLLRRRRG